MFSHLNRWALSTSTAAITVVGTFIPVFSPLPAQAAPACRPLAPITGPTLPGNVPPAVRTQSSRAAIAYGNPDVTLTRYDRQTSDGVSTIESTGRQTNTAASALPGNGCILEVDVVVRGQSEQVVGIEEVEEQLATFLQLPAAVRSRLNQQLPNYRLTFIERSRRFDPPQIFPNNQAIPSDEIVYELEGTCTGTNPIPGPTPGNYCVNGQEGEAQISEDGLNFEFEPSS